jgi:hypothetical protein
VRAVDHAASDERAGRQVDHDLHDAALVVDQRDVRLSPRRGAAVNPREVRRLRGLRQADAHEAPERRALGRANDRHGPLDLLRPQRIQRMGRAAAARRRAHDVRFSLASGCHVRPPRRGGTPGRHPSRR